MAHSFAFQGFALGRAHSKRSLPYLAAWREFRFDFGVDLGQCGKGNNVDVFEIFKVLTAGKAIDVLSTLGKTIPAAGLDAFIQPGNFTARLRIPESSNATARRQNGAPIGRVCAGNRVSMAV